MEIIGIVTFIVTAVIIAIKYKPHLLEKLTFPPFGFTLRDEKNDVVKGNIVRSNMPFDVQKSVLEKFPSYKDYVVLQYGSSVRMNAETANDTDYIVLLLGFPKTEEERVMLHTGHVPLPDDISPIKYDVVFRDYNSFLFALIYGMPYEHSVVRWSRTLYGHKGYHNWCKRLAKNILIDRDFVMKAIAQERIPDLEMELQTENNVENYYDYLRYSYFLASYRIQWILLKDMKEVLRHEDVATLALSDTMIGGIQSVEAKLFSLMLNYIKRKVSPSSMDEVKKLHLELNDALRKRMSNG